MTVAELIERLGTFPPDAVLVCYDEDGDTVEVRRLSLDLRVRYPSGWYAYPGPEEKRATVPVLVVEGWSLL